MNKGLRLFVQLAGAIAVVAVVVAIILLLFHFVSPDKEGTLPTVHHPIQTPQNNSAEAQAAAAPVPATKSSRELNAELRQEIVRKRKEAEALEARKREAFKSWWHMPEWCLDEGGMKALVQCSDLKRAKRAEFDELLAAGKIALPPASEDETAP